jgi:hypothetical protein
LLRLPVNQFKAELPAGHAVALPCGGDHGQAVRFVVWKKVSQCRKKAFAFSTRG